MQTSTTFTARHEAHRTPLQVSRLVSPLVRLWQAAYLRYRAHVTTRKLQSLDDRMLKDIGLDRSEIASAARHNADQRRRSVMGIGGPFPMG